MAKINCTPSVRQCHILLTEDFPVDFVHGQLIGVGEYHIRMDRKNTQFPLLSMRIA